jgi:DNA-binding LytR/AlgR family response regulator
MNCLIVDDDPMVRLDLEKRIGLMANLSLAASCGTATEAAGILLKENIDVIFLDIEMPGMDGLSLLKTMHPVKPAVILITSKKEYAAEAFDYEVTDFLLKPFTDERFLKSIMRASSHMASELSGSEKDHLFVKTNSVLEKIDLSDILYVEAMADYVQIQSDKKRYVVHSTMKNIENALPVNRFFRAHNSYIIHLNKINRIEDNSVIIGDKVIPVSRAKIKTLLQQINLLSGD